MQRTTLGELALWEPPSNENDYFQRFIRVIDEFYPDDWRSWEVNHISYEDLFGERISSDEECRLRFAVPTLHLAYVFSDGSPSLSERKYKSIKRQLITWPLGRAIIYSPFATMKKIHPTDAGNRFTEVLSLLKAQLMSRSEAAKILQNTETKSRSPFKMPFISQKRAHSLGPAPYKRARNEDCDTLTDFLRQQNIMLEKLCKLSEDQNENLKLLREKISNKCANCGDPVVDKSESQFPSEEKCRCVRSYNQAKPLRDLEERSPIDDLVEDSASTVSVETKEISALSIAEDNLVQQGIACQRLGTDGWQNINFAEGQKRFQATPVFSNLQVNGHLASITPPGQLTAALEKMDLYLAAITHGLLQQRKEFKETYQKAPLEVKSIISKYFWSPESSFRRTSDALFQYTCGRRAEVIHQRRSVYKPSNEMLHDLLHMIPPSSTHLFSEPKLSELVEEHGGIQEFFPDKSNIKPKAGRKGVFRELDVGDRSGSSETFKKPNAEASVRGSFIQRRTRSNASKAENI